MPADPVNGTAEVEFPIAPIGGSGAPPRGTRLPGLRGWRIEGFRWVDAVVAFAVLVAGSDSGVCGAAARPWGVATVGVMTRFGVQLPNFSGFDPADLFDHVAGLATAAEEAGFDSVWVMDHFF